MDWLIGIAALVAALAFVGLAQMFTYEIRRLNVRLSGIRYDRKRIHTLLKTLGYPW